MNPLQEYATVSARSVYDPASPLTLTVEGGTRVQREPPLWEDTGRYSWWKLRVEGRRGQRGLGRLTVAGETRTSDGDSRSELRPSIMVERWGETLEIRAEAGVVYPWGTSAGDLEYWQSLRGDLGLGANLACRVVVSMREGGGEWSGRGEARVTVQL